MKLKLKVLVGLVVVLALLAALTLYLRHVGGVAVFEPRGPVAYQERKLIYFGLLLSVIVVVPVFIMAATIGWKYRETNTKAKYQPDWDHSRLAETIWWGIPALLIGILSVVAWNSSHSLDPFRPLPGSTPPMTIQVVALDWKWLFIYPQDHIATVNYVQFPVNTPVTFDITSDAPMNSFWIPQLGGQIYAMPGMSTQLHLMASSPGNFYGSSANISGRGFANMHFMAHATTDAAYYQWAARVKRSDNHLNIYSYNQLATPSTHNHPADYALDQSDLYSSILDKYMTAGTMPEMDMQMAGMGN
jgi:cytochrome o ubiquinol oxidase subunit II